MTRITPRVTIGLIALLAAGVPLIGCKPRSAEPAFSGEVKVAVSFPALYSLAANVVGDTGTVRSVKSTQGAHGGEVTDAERRVIESADVLFINGLGLDDEFARKLRESSANPGIKVELLGNSLKKKTLLDSGGCACCAHDHEGGDAHADHDHDPHVWMGIDRAIAMVDTIADKLSEKYPGHKDTFRRNADTYKAKLAALKKEGVDALGAGSKADRKIVTAHGSMGYFADTFGLTIVDSIQKTAGKEPTQKQLDELIEKCKKEGVKVIAAEPQFSKLGGVKTLAEELDRRGVKVTVIELDNLETATTEELNAGWYEAKMRANITALKGVFK
jgi:zinc transport system substrate-binding protein